MQLHVLPKGKEARIDKINSVKLALQLAQMGIVSKVPIKIMEKNSKTILIASHSTRIILGIGIAASIEVFE